MSDFVLFALLPGRENFFAGIVFEQHGTVFFEIEIFAGDLLSIEEGECCAVGEESAEFFHEVERERWASRAIAVEEAALGIEAATFQRAAAVVHEEDVKEGKQGIDRIERRAAGASVDGDLGIVIGEEVGEDGEIGGGGVPFYAAQGIERGGSGNEANADCEEIGGLIESESALGRFYAVIASGPHQYVSRVGELCRDHVGGDGYGGWFMIGTAVLFAAQKDVTRSEAIRGSKEFAVGVVKTQRDFGLGAGGHQSSGAGNVPTEAGNAIEVVKGDAELGFAFMAYLDGGTVFTEVSSF